jgi:hypothetical protein
MREKKGSTFTRSRPRTVPRPSWAEDAASSSAASNGDTCAWKRRPSSVSVIERVVRSNRRMPSRASSLATERLTPEGVMSSSSEAAAKLPLSTMAHSTPMPFIMRSSNAMPASPQNQ